MEDELMSRNSKQYMPTYVLIAANVAVYAFTSILSGSLTTGDDVAAAFGQINAAVWNGEAWRLFTAMFIHADIVHIFGNMFFLLIFGLRAEDMFDIKEYLLIYLLSGLSGGLLTLTLWPPETLSIGASGAIFGVLGATIIYARRSIGQSIMGALIYAFFFFIINVGANVNYLAHLGGLATGLLIGYALAASRRYKPRVTYEYRYPDSWGKAGYAFEHEA
jgi:rhomboid protease GluP